MAQSEGGLIPSHCFSSIEAHDRKLGRKKGHSLSSWKRAAASTTTLVPLYLAAPLFPNPPNLNSIVARNTGIDTFPLRVRRRRGQVIEYLVSCQPHSPSIYVSISIYTIIGTKLSCEGLRRGHLNFRTTWYKFHRWRKAHKKHHKIQRQRFPHSSRDFIFTFQQSRETTFRKKSIRFHPPRLSVWGAQYE